MAVDDPKAIRQLFEAQRRFSDFLQSIVGHYPGAGYGGPRLPRLPRSGPQPANTAGWSNMAEPIRPRLFTWNRPADPGGGLMAAPGPQWAPEFHDWSTPPPIPSGNPPLGYETRGGGPTQGPREVPEPIPQGYSPPPPPPAQHPPNWTPPPPPKGAKGGGGFTGRKTQ